MADATDIQTILALALDSKTRGNNFLSTGQDLLRKADGMLGYAQAHCEHEFVPPPAAYVHEGGCCKHCSIMEVYAAQHKKQWLALDAVGKAPWTPRPQAKRPEKTKTLEQIQIIGRGTRQLGEG